MRVAIVVPDGRENFVSALQAEFTVANIGVDVMHQLPDDPSIYRAVIVDPSLRDVFKDAQSLGVPVYERGTERLIADVMKHLGQDIPGSKPEKMGTGLHIDKNKKSGCRLNGEDIRLTDWQYAILRILATTPNKVVTFSELREKLSEAPAEGDNDEIRALKIKVRLKVREKGGIGFGAQMLNISKALEKNEIVPKHVRYLKSWGFCHDDPDPNLSVQILAKDANHTVLANGRSYYQEKGYTVEVHFTALETLAVAKLIEKQWAKDDSGVTDELVNYLKKHATRWTDSTFSNLLRSIENKILEAQSEIEAARMSDHLAGVGLPEDELDSPGP